VSRPPRGGSRAGEPSTDGRSEHHGDAGSGQPGQRWFLQWRPESLSPAIRRNRSGVEASDDATADGIHAISCVASRVQLRAERGISGAACAGWQRRSTDRGLAQQVVSVIVQLACGRESPLRVAQGRGASAVA
jgi:hypothetical protein